MSSINWNVRSWDWEDWSGDSAALNDDIKQAKTDEASRKANLEAQAKTAVEEEDKVRKRAEVLAALSTSGFSSSGTNTARSFLTSL